MNKNSGSSKNYENVHFWGVFRDFFENGSNDFDKTLPNSRRDRYEAFAKNRTSKSFSVLEIFEDHPVSKLWDFVQILMLLGQMTSKRSGNHISNVLNWLRVVEHDFEIIHQVFLGQNDIYGWSKIYIFAYILLRLGPMTSKPLGNHQGDV